MNTKYKLDKVIKKVHPGWHNFFKTNAIELETILNFVNDSAKTNEVFPIPSQLFQTLFYFPPEETKLVILGQDPYIGSEIHEEKKVPQACGMSFSVPKCHKNIPPSLKNIYKEISNCYPDYKVPTHGFLKKWVRKEHILLLNSALTVIEKKSNSHQAFWGAFTDKLIKYISDSSPHTVFLLMGNFAIGKAQLINKSKHKIFTAVHPSPLSASNGFFGSGVFKNINEYFISKQMKPINWNP